MYWIESSFNRIVSPRCAQYAWQSASLVCESGDLSRRTSVKAHGSEANSRQSSASPCGTPAVEPIKREHPDGVSVVRWAVLALICRRSHHACAS